MDDNAATRAVAQYMAAWNEPDASLRQALLQQCWSEHGVYVDPMVSLQGRAALDRHIARVQSGRPGARLEFMSGVDVHHDVVRFLWRLVRADGTCGDTSIDFGEFGPDGRLVKIAGFFGPARPRPPDEGERPAFSQLPPVLRHVMTPLKVRRGAE